jgi:hypothetical protein
MSMNDDTRRFLAWRVSITLEVDFCIEAVEEALARHGAPEIINSDQGSQFTSTDFIKVLAARSKTGRGGVTVPIFLLVPQVKVPKRLDLARDAKRAHDAVPGRIVASWLNGRLV